MHLYFEKALEQEMVLCDRFVSHRTDDFNFAIRDDVLRSFEPGRA